ncbi:MAG: hypothetical protein V5A13_04215 [Haloarculaceae archaeon]
MKRRAVLASLAATLPGLGGCAALTDDDGRTLTPARVPDAGGVTPRVRVTETPELSDCPRLPAEADRHVCSPEVSEGLRMLPGTKRHDGDPGGLRFTLRNRDEHRFEADRGRWLLTQQTAGGWLTIDGGTTGDDLSIGPGEEVTWVVGGASREARTGQIPVGANAEGPVVRFDAGFGSGVHAFVVTGDVDGRLTAVAAPFRVDPPGP